MFILIPFFLIIISVVGIAVIVWRKMPFLRKLTPEANETNGSIVYEFFPEIAGGIKNFDFQRHKNIWLVEFEKALRKLRVIALRIDSLFELLIKKTRGVYINNAKIETPAQLEEEKGTPKVVEKPNLAEELKKEEQRLIIEIAKDPKNAGLYETLGDLYQKTADYNDAKEAYEAAMKLKPDDERIKLKLSAVLQKSLILSESADKDRYAK